MKYPRTEARELEDPLSDIDSQYELCRLTGYSYNKLIKLIASQKSIQIRTAVKAIRCSNRAIYYDNGLWSMLVQWIALYVDQWEATFRKTMKDLVTLPDPAKILEVTAKALNINPDVLVYYSEHREELEAFLETQRGLLGMMAELELWKLVQAGDPATIRWLLPRIRNKEFGDKEPAPTKNETINIIEVEGHVK